MTLAVALRPTINQPWRSQAACNLTTARLFDGSLDGQHEDVGRRRRRHLKAVAICRTCPVRPPCLAAAFDGEGRYAEEGVRGAHIPPPALEARHA